MMVTKHTPGPWSSHFANDNINCDCKYILSDTVPISVATISYRKNDSMEESEHPDLEEAKYNAKLIAAAPEMLDIIENIYMHGHDAITVNAMNRMEQLIKKATE